MSDIESKVINSLRAGTDPGRPIDTGQLRTGAIARARAIRARRHVVGTATALGLVAVVGAGVLTLPRPGAGGDAAEVGWGAESAATVGSDTALAAPPATTLPRAPGVPSAEQNPAAVGTDPSVLHFDLDFAALGRVVSGVDASEWRSDKGYEKVSVPGESGSGPKAEVIIAQNPEVIDRVRSMPGWTGHRRDGTRIETHEEGPVTPIAVRGKPGTLSKATLAVKWPNGRDEWSWMVVWQPRAGLYAFAQVFSADRSVALAVAEAVRFDRAQRCAVPLRLTALPAGATWTGCRSAVRHRPAAGRGVWRLSELLLDLPGGGRASVWAEEDRKVWHPGDVAQFVPNRTVAGRPAQWRTSDPRGLWLLGFGPAELFVSGVAEPDAVRLVEGLKLAGNLAKPVTWPPRPVG